MDENKEIKHSERLNNWETYLKICKKKKKVHWIAADKQTDRLKAVYDRLIDI